MMRVIMEIPSEEGLGGSFVVLESPDGELWFSYDEDYGVLEELPAPENPYESHV